LGPIMPFFFFGDREGGEKGEENLRKKRTFKVPDGYRTEIVVGEG